MFTNGQLCNSLASLNSTSAVTGNGINQANLNFTPESGVISLSEHNNVSSFGKSI